MRIDDGQKSPAVCQSQKNAPRLFLGVLDVVELQRDVEKTFFGFLVRDPVLNPVFITVTLIPFKFHMYMLNVWQGDFKIF